MTADLTTAGSSDRSTAEECVVPTADGPMPALLYRPATDSGPGVVLVQEIFGVGDYIKRRAADLAALGYVVVVPEVYWRLPDATIDPSGDTLAQAMGLVQQLDWPAAVQDVAAAVRHTRDLPGVAGAVGLLGFCFGGGLAFAVAAVQPVDALVSYYGSALGDLLALAEQVSAPSLHHFGTDDTYVLPSTQDAIRRAVTAQGARFETYDGAGHAFDNPDPAFHHPDASRAAWDATVAFLAEHLGDRASSVPRSAH
jgi:carboxymethylenebutenolidase